MDNDLELKRNHISILSNIHIRNGIIFLSASWHFDICTLKDGWYSITNGEIILFKNRTIIVYNCATKSNKEILKIKCSKTPKRVSVIGFLLPKNFIDKESLV